MFSLASSLLPAAAAGDGSSSGSATPEKETRKPYIRVELASTLPNPNATIAIMVAPPPIPLLLQPHVSLADWNNFWSYMQPILRQVHDSTATYSVVHSIMFALYLVACVLLVVVGIVYHDETAEYYYLLVMGFFAAIYLAAWAVQGCHGFLRAGQFRALCDACHRAQDQIFGTSGYSVQCTYEWEIKSLSRGVAACGFYIYFFPISTDYSKSHETKYDGDDDSHAERHGYLRIRLFKSILGGSFSWNPFSMPYLESFQTLPNSLSQTAGSAGQELWTRFWSEMLSASRHYLWIYRVFYPITYVWLVLILLQTAPWFPIEVQLVLLCVLLIPMVYSSCRLLPATRSRDKLVERYADEFASHGWLVEYRRCYEFDERSNRAAVHYLYVFPLPAGAVNDNGSELV
jgi:hypothetical protein